MKKRIPENDDDSKFKVLNKYSIDNDKTIEATFISVDEDCTLFYKYTHISTHNFGIQYAHYELIASVNNSKTVIKL